MYAKKELVDIKDALNMICRESIMAYPPGIPIIAPGEIITEDTHCEFENYGDNLISDGAVLLAIADKNNPEGINIKLQK